MHSQLSSIAGGGHPQIQNPRTQVVTRDPANMELNATEKYIKQKTQNTAKCSVLSIAAVSTYIVAAAV
jgi:hypothetical protein